jgi:large subunit ribosomal protein L6
MSRVGKQIIKIPEKTEVTFASGSLKVKGPKGELSRDFKKTITIKIADGQITLTPENDNIETNALWGTYASHISNMVEGVNNQFIKKLLIEGIGFKADVQGQKLILNLGFSHPVIVNIPQGLTVTVEKGVISVTGIDKESVGMFAADIRALKKPEPYKGKGIRYENEIIRRKQGKKSV